MIIIFAKSCVRTSVCTYIKNASSLLRGFYRGKELVPWFIHLHVCPSHLQSLAIVVVSGRNTYTAPPLGRKGIFVVTLPSSSIVNKYNASCVAMAVFLSSHADCLLRKPYSWTNFCVILKFKHYQSFRSWWRHGVAIWWCLNMVSWCRIDCHCFQSFCTSFNVTSSSVTGLVCAISSFSIRQRLKYTPSRILVCTITGFSIRHGLKYAPSRVLIPFDRVTASRRHGLPRVLVMTNNINRIIGI